MPDEPMLDPESVADELLMADVPPPPAGGAAYRDAQSRSSSASEGDPREPDPLDAAIAVAQPRPRGRPFNADVDIAEIDDRGRPGAVFQGRARSLSRANIVLTTRRMCYTEKELVVAIHLIDDTPIALRGQVFSCVYDGEGRHLLDLDLVPMKNEPIWRKWAQSLGTR